MRPVVQPISIIGIAILMDQPALPVRLVVFPLALIFAPVLPDLDASTFALPFGVPLPLVNRIIVKLTRSLGVEVWILEQRLVVEEEGTEPRLGLASCMV